MTMTINKQYLIDTQCWLWWYISPEKLSQKQYDIIENADNAIYFSIISAWEINLKYRLKKLKLPSIPSSYIAQRIGYSQMNVLELQLEHTLVVENLPPFHRDPFDRLLITQAQLENMTILTNDRAFEPYDIRLVF
jgi:PIN domain nuclease of toxin-antitoxin system